VRTTSRREPIEVTRGVRAVRVPSGAQVLLEAGRTGFLTQQRGGAFTVRIGGELFRIDGIDGDAIGREPVVPRRYPANPDDDEIPEMVWAELREVYDPEIPCSIVDLGLVYACEVKKIEGGVDFEVSIRMTVTAPGCGMGEQLANEVAGRLDRLPRVADYVVEVVYDPPWDRSMMSYRARLELGLF
jgi:probable FeS assembly SUF system protein SufT